MVYEINKKPYIKVENYYAELKITKDGLIPVKNFTKIYEENVDKSKIKSYNSSEEYINKVSKESNFEKKEIKRRNKLL